ncbi:MAG: hypothetical protein OXG26_11815 [Caldilineaceae bacterium]|nr:hypothetical protein [Caldilineaceae bacterium]
MVAAKLFQNYIKSLQANLARGNVAEHTHRPTLKTLLESVDDRVTATNEPKRIACGAPDFVITRSGPNPLTVGYVEAKDAGIAPDVWKFRVGGYQPLDKWLKDRRGRTSRDAPADAKDRRGDWRRRRPVCRVTISAHNRAALSWRNEGG